MTKSGAAKRRRNQKARAASLAGTDPVRARADKHTHDVPAQPKPTTAADALDRFLTTKAGTLRLTGALTAAAVCVAVLFVTRWAGAERQQQAYERAPACAADATTDCTAEIHTTISAKSQTIGTRYSSYYLTLDAFGQVAIPQASVWADMDVGDGVTATMWNGQVVKLTDGTVSSLTSAAPLQRTTFYVALIDSSVDWVVVFALFAIRVFEVGRGREPGWSRALIPVNIVAGLSLPAFLIGSFVGAVVGSALSVVLCGIGASVVAGSYFIFNWIRKHA